MNPLFGGLGNIMQTVNAIQQVRQNPSQLGQILYDHNKINQTQLEEINRLGGNPQQIGNYLINNNIMTQQQAQQMYQSTPQIQSVLNNK